MFELVFLDVHVLEFAGFKDLTAFEAFDKLRLLVAGDDLHTGMLAFVHCTSLFGDCAGEIEVIKPDFSPKTTITGE